MHPTATSADHKRAQEQLEILEDLIDALRKAGAEVPSGVSAAIKALRFAIDTGGDLGDASASAAAAIAQYYNKVNVACGDDLNSICQARDLHYYQAVNKDYTLNWNNKDSVTKELCPEYYAALRTTTNMRPIGSL